MFRVQYSTGRSLSLSGLLVLVTVDVDVIWMNVCAGWMETQKYYAHKYFYQNGENYEIVKRTFSGKRKAI